MTPVTRNNIFRALIINQFIAQTPEHRITDEGTNRAVEESKRFVSNTLEALPFLQGMLEKYSQENGELNGFAKKWATHMLKIGVKAPRVNFEQQFNNLGSCFAGLAAIKNYLSNNIPENLTPRVMSLIEEMTDVLSEYENLSVVEVVTEEKEPEEADAIV